MEIIWKWKNAFLTSKIIAKMDMICMEIKWKWKNARLTSKILVKMDMKLYGNHMEMEKRPSDIKNIS